MRRFIALAVAAIAAMFILVGCGPNSTQGVQVVGDNIARLPVGETMVLHREGKGSFDWIITYGGGSSVHFFRDLTFSDDDVDITLGDEEVKYDPGWAEVDLWVSRRSDHAVNIRWEDGLTFEGYEPANG